MHFQSVCDFIEARLAPYRRSGRNEIRTSLCPFCSGGQNGDMYTFSFNIENNSYYCFRGSCYAKGGIEQLAAHFQDTIQGTRREGRKDAYSAPTTKMYPITQEIIDYFNSRGIHEQTLNAYHIGSDNHGNILFPFTLDGDLVYVKHRPPHVPRKDQPKEWADANTRPILFGMDQCVPGQPLVITEGMIDMLSLCEAGVPNAVSVPSGCENTRWVEETWDWLERFDQIILFGDNDTPGKQMVKRLSKRLGESKCRIVEWYPDSENGEPCKDANEILTQLGDLALLETLSEAKDIPIRGLIDLGMVTPEDPTQVERISTNIPELDGAIGGLRMGAITVFTGQPGNGKSTLAGTLLLNGIENGYRCCAFSGEMNASEFQSWINFQAAGSDYITLKYDPIKKKNVPYVPPNIAEALSKWYAGKLWIYDNNEIFEGSQADAILEVFTMAARRYDCKLFLVDSLMCATGDTDEETRAQGKFVTALKRFANKFQVHVILIAHARKLAPGKTRIGQDDIAGNSGTIRLAHSAVVVEKPNLRVIKSRDSGSLKLIECCYCPDSHRIYQKSIGDLNRFHWNDGTIFKCVTRACDTPEYEIVVGESDAGF